MVKKSSGKRRKKESNLKTYLIAFIPAIILVIALVYIISIPPQVTVMQKTTNTVKLETGQDAPDFTLEIIDENGLTGETFSFKSLVGKPIFMDFAFEWCPHCNNMAPTIKKLYENYHSKGIEFVTVLGGSGTDTAKTADFIKRHEIIWTAVFDADMKVFTLYGVRGTPTYFIIDDQGKVVKKLIGEQPYDRLAALLDAVLRK